MKSKRLLALLLTLLLAVSCTVPVLATPEDGFLDQFEITVPQLPGTDNTVADVLGASSVTGTPSLVTYNDGATISFFYPDSDLQIKDSDAKTMDLSDGFAAGKKYNFWFATKLAEGMDINNSIMSEDAVGNILLNLPVYINGTKAENSIIYYRPEADVITVNAFYTVPAGDVLKEVFIDGLALPEDGMSVADSYAEATAYFNSPENVREIKSVLWQEVTSDGHLINMTDTDRFEKGKQYRVEISIERRGEVLNVHPDPDTAQSWIVADVYVNSEKVYTGSGKETPNFALYDNYRFSNKYICDESGQTAGERLKEVFIDGLALPADGMSVADSYAEATAYFNSPENVREIKSVLWQEVTSDGHLINMTDTDRFEKGKQYRVEISIERRGEVLNVHPDPDTAQSWIVADVYVNSEKVYTGSGKETPNFALYDNYRFSNRYICTESGQPAGEMLKEIHIDGLALPVDGMTAYQSFTNCVVKEMTVTSMTWHEVTPDGHRIKMVNTDQFKAGTEYTFTITMDAADYEVDHHTSPAPSSWVVADVYLNGELVYNYVDDMGLRYLDYYENGKSEREIFFLMHFTAGGASSPSDNPFTDVGQEDYFYDAVLWAFNHDPQITDGMTDTTFGPSLTVTRGQCVTFLWRAMGKPEPSSDKNPFTDVPADQYYYKAVLWAVENGITDGMTDTTFEPNTTLSTAHIITFLYRTLGIGTNGWYQEAADWAVRENLLDKMDLKVDPGVNCPRGSVVTFLYRELK